MKASSLTLSALPGSKPTRVAKANFFTTFFCFMWVRWGVFGEVGLSLGRSKPNSAWRPAVAATSLFALSDDCNGVGLTTATTLTLLSSIDDSNA